jgi:hypothetical protein
MLRALTPEIRANSSNRYSAKLCTATMHATTLAVKKVFASEVEIVATAIC